MLVCIALLALYFYVKLLPTLVLLVGMTVLTGFAWYGFSLIHRVPLKDRFEQLEYALIMRQQSIALALTVVTILMWVLMLRQ